MCISQAEGDVLGYGGMIEGGGGGGGVGCGDRERV